MGKTHGDGSSVLAIKRNEDKCVKYDYSAFRLTDNSVKVIIKQMRGCDNAGSFLKLGSETKATHYCNSRKWVRQSGK